MKKIEKAEEMIDHLTRVCAAYRKSYKLCGNINTALLITTGIISSTAVLALVPAIPIFVAAAGAVPVVTGVISSKLKLQEKKTVYKAHHKSFKQLLSYCQTVQNDDPNLITTVFNKILEIQKGDNYVEPLERYIKEYNLNGYIKD